MAAVAAARRVGQAQPLCHFVSKCWTRFSDTLWALSLKPQNSQG